MLSGQNRGDAVYAQVSAQPGFTSLNAAEQQSVKTQLRAFFQADTAYVVANAQVNPGTLNNPTGQPVQVVVPGGSGTTVAPQTIVGVGNVT